MASIGFRRNLCCKTRRTVQLTRMTEAGRVTGPGGWIQLFGYDLEDQWNKVASPWAIDFETAGVN